MQGDNGEPCAFSVLDVGAIIACDRWVAKAIEEIILEKQIFVSSMVTETLVTY